MKKRLDRGSRPPTSRIRVYADTSVYGGAFDDRFEIASRQFFEEIEMGRFDLVVSALVQEEIRPAPANVRSLFAKMLEYSEIAPISNEAIRLREAYLEADILPKTSSEDAFHVALATANRCTLIVSWNFKHIVHFRRIPRYNAVNVLHGYPAIAIYSPLEVLSYEEKTV